MRFAGGTAELLPNGFVRVECFSGLVRLYERTTEGFRVRSGYGSPSRGEMDAVQRLFGC